MISQNVYVRYSIFDSKESVLSFISGEMNYYSNSENWRSDIEKLLAHKEKHKRNYTKDSKYRNIFGYYLKVLIPDEALSDVNLFVKEFMYNIDFRFQKNLYVFKKQKQGQGVYAEILAFTRFVYKKTRKETRKYNRDYYYNASTKKMCKADDPGAVLVHKKGDVVLDKNNQPVVDEVEVSPVEDRIFVYHSITELTKRLKKAVVKFLTEFIKVEMIHYLVSRITIKNTYSNELKKKLMNKNLKIRAINQKLTVFMKNMILGQMADKNHILQNNYDLANQLNQLVYDKHFSYKKAEDYLNNWWNENVIAPIYS